MSVSTRMGDDLSVFQCDKLTCHASVKIENWQAGDRPPAGWFRVLIRSTLSSVLYDGCCAAHAADAFAKQLSRVM